MMEKIGKFFFKNRSFLPIPILLVAVFYPRFDGTVVSFLVGYILVLSAEVGRFWCVSYAGGITRTRKGDLNELVVAGPWVYVRNPIYVFNMIMYVGASIMIGSIWFAPWALAYFIIQYTFIVAYEEGLLKNSFGSEYDEYKKHVWRWLPLPARLTRVKKSHHRPSFVEAYSAERSTINSIIAITIIGIVRFAIWQFVILR